MVREKALRQHLLTKVKDVTRILQSRKAVISNLMHIYILESKFQMETSVIIFKKSILEL
jgi:hypothetical protein